MQEITNVYVNSREIKELPHDLSTSDVLTARKGHLTDMPLMMELEQQVAAWNATRRDFDRDVCVPQLVAMQAAASRDAIALVVGDQVLSYRELNRRANQLAHYLQTLGVRPNVL